MRRQRALVLASGGMDSSVTVAIAAQEHDLAMLHISYGQRTKKKELQAFHAIADYYAAEKRSVVSIEYLRTIGGSSLTDDAIPVSAPDLSNREIPSSYVPFRNGNMLSIAVSWAEVIGASKIFLGAVEEDSSGYPDCRREFFDLFESAIEAGTRPDTHIRLMTPLISMRKSDIVRLGSDLGVPFESTWSCYANEDHACGVCDSCALRLRGFQEAGINDPLSYVKKPVYAVR